MIKRFSLYGFLKNQRYFEPFLLLYFLELGLSYSQIGILVAIREIFLNIAEIPSGALADVYGRRKSLIFSFSSYIISFVIFGFSNSFLTLVPAMLFFAIGDAFRTGTHKAMIFTWLRSEGRIDDKNKVYGYTRSWSKLGSALSIVIATAILLIKPEYKLVFFFSIIPYILGIINFLGYPKVVDGNGDRNTDLKGLIQHLYTSFKFSYKTTSVRRLIIESMGFEGLFKAVKEYIQPVIQNMALATSAFLTLSAQDKETVGIGIIYFILSLLSAVASRNSHKIKEKAGDEEKASKLILIAAFVIYAALVPLFYYKMYIPAVGLFVLLNIIQNFWRPILISRFDNYSDESKGATILSIESQSKTLATTIFAPLIGYSIDFVKHNNYGGEFWTIGLFGALISFALIATAKGNKSRTT